MKRALGLGAAALVLLPGPPARALRPPPTALSVASRAPGELLDDDANALQFPQLAAELDPAVFALGAHGDPSVDSGIRIRFGRQALSYQAVQYPSDEASRTVTRFASAHYQAAWSARLPFARVGASFTWSTDAARQRRLTLNDSPGVDEYVRNTFSADDIREGAIGLGWGEVRRLDVVVEVASERLEYDFSDRHILIAPDTQFSTRYAANQKNRTGLRLGGAILAVLPVGEGARLRLFARARDARHDLDREVSRRSVRDGLITLDEQAPRNETSPGSELAAGIRLEGTGRHGASWSTHVYWERVRTAWRYDIYPSPYLSRERRLSDDVEAGVSVRRAGPAGLQLMGGLSVGGSRRRDLTEDEGPSDRVRRRSETRETLTQDSSWGARRTFGPVQLTGAMSRRLSPADLISVLDIRIAF